MFFIKLASDIIANRFKSVLNQLFSKEQTCFLRGRFIGQNGRLVYDIMQYCEYCEEKNIPGLLMSIDFEKAFDSISFGFIKKNLQFLTLTRQLKNGSKCFCITLMYLCTVKCVFIKFFHCKENRRQGNLISAYIYISCVEMLNIKLKNNKNIKGNDKEDIISQFADDTTLLLDGSEKSLGSILKLQEESSHISGLKVNFEKNKLIWIGSMKYSTRSIKTKWKLSWGGIQFKMLSITFHVTKYKKKQYTILEEKKVNAFWQKSCCKRYP